MIPAFNLKIIREKSLNTNCILKFSQTVRLPTRLSINLERTLQASSRAIMFLNRSIHHRTLNSHKLTRVRVSDTRHEPRRDNFWKHRYGAKILACDDSRESIKREHKVHRALEDLQLGLIPFAASRPRYMQSVNTPLTDIDRAGTRTALAQWRSGLPGSRGPTRF